MTAVSKAPTSVPPAVRISFWLQIAGVTIGVGSFVWYFVTQHYSSAGEVISALIACIVVTALALVLAERTLRGRAWARMFLTVLAVLSVVLLIIDLARGMFDYTAIDLISSVASYSGVVLLWLPTARTYFTDTKAALHPAKPLKPYLDPKNR